MSILVDFVVPIIAAVISGGLTLLGVRKTIKNSNKQDAENLKKSAKPWVYSVDSKDIYSRSNVVTISLSPVKGKKIYSESDLYIKNTDNGICIIKCIKTENNTYIPTSLDVVEKNTIARIRVNYGEKETLKNIVLCVSDVYDNLYEYSIDLNTFFIHELKQETKTTRRSDHARL